MEFGPLAPNPGIGQHVHDEGLHPLDPVDRERDVPVGVLVELPLVAPRQELGVIGDHPQRFLEVVRGDVGELLELLIRSRELLVLELDDAFRQLALA